MTKVSLDANVLVYGVDKSDPVRHRAARRIITAAARSDCVISLQALAEFYYVVTRKGKQSAAEAREQVNALRAIFPVAFPGAATLDRAIEAGERFRLGFWDAMLWAGVREAGVTLLLSEDFQDGQTIEGVRIANPFTRSPAELRKLLK